MSSLVAVSRSKKEKQDTSACSTDPIDCNKKASVRFYKTWHDRLRRHTKYSKWSTKRKREYLEERMEDFKSIVFLIQDSPYV